MRAFFDLRPLITADLSQLEGIYLSTQRIDDADVTTYASLSKNLAISEADYAVPFAGVTNAKYVLLVAEQEVSIRLNGILAPLVPVRPHPASATADVLSNTQLQSQAGVFFLAGKVTSIHVTNPSSAAVARFFCVLVGEAS